MSTEDRSKPDYIRILLNCVFIGLGCTILFGFLDITIDNFWVPWVFAIIGVFVASSSGTGAKVAGLLVALVGVYGLLRYYDLITNPLLRYGIGFSLILFGIVNLVRGPTGGASPKNKTPEN